MPRMRNPLTPQDQRDIAKREPRRSLQPAERNALDQRQDGALEAGEVDELAVLRTGARTGARGLGPRAETRVCARFAGASLMPPA